MKLKQTLTLTVSLLFCIQLYADPPAVNALPSGGDVVVGDAIISEGDDQLDIDQSTDQLIVNWLDFNIGADASVNFNQPGLDSVALNRILGNDPTSIFGSLNSNGQVFLLNPNGVLFGEGSRVDTGGLVATTMSLSNEDFLSGDYSFFSERDDTSVVNRGYINADGAYVGLFAPRVLNEGVIRASFGSVVMASGETITMGIEGNQLLSVAVENDNFSTLAANREIVRGENGELLLSSAASQSMMDAVVPVASDGASQIVEGADGVVRLVASSGSIYADTIAIDAGKGQAIVSGTLDASGFENNGGKVIVLGDRVSLQGGTHIDVSGNSGGEILIGGDFQGNNAELHNATTTFVDSTVKLDASAQSNGDGGKVIVWANGLTEYRGDILARGGASGGDGGFVEVSGKEKLLFRGFVDAGAEMGQGGTLLLDPKNITIADGGGDSAASADNEFLDNAASDVTIAPSSIEAIIGNGSNTNITLQANNDIDITDAIISDGSGVMTFEAGRSITVNGTISTNNSNIFFNFNDVDADSGNRDAGVAEFANNSLINAGTANVVISADDTSTVNVVNVDTGIINADNLSITHLETDQGGTITLGGVTINGDLTVNASTGDVDVVNTTTDGSIRVLGSTRITTAGDVDIQGSNTDLEVLGVIANNVTIYDKKALQIGASGISSLISGDLNLDIVGPIGNSGAVTVAGRTYIKTIDGGFGIAEPSITLTNASNDFNEVIVDQASTGQNAHFQDANDLIIGGTFADDLGIVTGGNMRDFTQAEMDALPDPTFSSGHTIDSSAVAPLTFLSGNNYTTLNAGATGNITFDHANTDFDNISVSNAQDVVLVDADSLRIYGSTTQNDFTLDAGGNIDLDNNDTFNFGGSLNLHNTAGYIEMESYVNLNVSDNLLLTSDAGFVQFSYDADAVVGGSMTIDASQYVYLADYADIDVNATTGTGNLAITAGGDIYQYQSYDNQGSLTVEGTSLFTVTAADSDLLLQQAANNMVGTVTMGSSGLGSYYDVDFRNIYGGGPAVLSGLESAGQMHNVTLYFDNAPSLELPGMNLTGNLMVDVPNGLITQSNEIIVAGDAEFLASNSQDITLDDVDNDFNDILFERANDVVLTDTDGFNFYAYHDGSYHSTDLTGNLTVTAGGDVTQTSYPFGVYVDGLASFTLGANNLTLNYDSYNQFNQLQIVSANNVDISTTTNVELLTSNIAGTFELDSDGGDTVTQGSGTTLTTGGNTIFRDFGNVTIANSGNSLGALYVYSPYGGTTQFKEDDAITQFSNWYTPSQNVYLTVEDDQAITMSNTSNYFGNLRITQENNGNATPGAVHIAEGYQMTQDGAWTTHGDTYIQTTGDDVYLNSSTSNVFGQLKVVADDVYIYENDTIEDYDNWSTDITQLSGYASGVLGDGDVVLDSAGNVMGDLYVNANNVTITENGHITDYSTAWTARGNVVLNPGASGSYQIILDNVSNVLGPIDIDGAPSLVYLYENDTITQAGAWDIGTAPITLNSRTNDIVLTETGNVLGNITVLVSNGTPNSVTITEDDSITQGGTEWVLAGKAVTLTTENDQAITLNDADNILGDLTMTGGAVSIRENDNITDGSAWTTTGTTTLNPGTTGATNITLNNTGNVLGDIAIAGDPMAITIVENDDITQAAAWVQSGVDMTLTVSDDNDILLSQTSNVLGDLSLTAGGANGDVSVVEADAITDGDAWTVGGTATLTAKSGGTLQDIVLDDVGPSGTIGTLQIIEAADVVAQVDVDVLQVDSATNVDLTDSDELDLNTSTVDSLLKISSGGHITQTGGSVTATDLLLVGSGYATLDDVTNDVANLAAGFTGGDLNFTNNDTFAVATVGGTIGIGINANDVTLRSVIGTVGSVSNISASSSSLSIDTGTGLSLPNMIIAGPQDYTAGGTGITLTSGIQNTSAGDVQFHSNVTVAADLSIQTVDSAILFEGTLDGSSNILTVNAGTSTVTFKDAVSGLGSAGDAQPSLNLTAGGTGSTFESTLSTNNGITVTGPVVFQDNVTLGDGAAGTLFGGQVTLGKVGGMDLTGYDSLRFSGGLVLQNGSTTINSNNSLLTFEGANTISGAFGLSLDSGTGEISGLDHVGNDLTSLNVTADEPVIPVAGISIAGPQSYTATGGTDITLQGDLTSTSAGSITFNSPVTVDASVAITTVDSEIVFDSTVDGANDLTLDSGTAASRFNDAVGDTTDIGDGTGAALTFLGSGDTLFSGVVLTNSGIVAAGPVTFTNDVTLGDGDTGSTFGGEVTTGGTTISGYDGLTFNAGFTMTDNTSIISNGSTIDFNAPVTGVYEIYLNALYGGAGTVTGLENMDTEITALTVLAHILGIPDGLAISGPMDFTAAGGITLNGDIGSALTPSTGQIDFHSPVTLAANSTITTADSAINFDGTVDGAFAFVLDPGTGEITFSDVIGGVTPLGSLIAQGISNLGGGSITTTGLQRFADAVTLTDDSVHTGSTVEFLDTVDGDNDLTVNATTTLFQGDVGQLTALSSITTNSTGTTTLDTANIKTSGAQDYGDAVSLANTVSLTGNGVAFRSTVDGAEDLSVDAGTGAARFEGEVGGVTALTELAVTGIAVQLVSDITTDAGVSTGDVTFTGPTTLEGDVVVSTGTGTAGDITLSGATSTVNGAQSLTLEAGQGDVVLDGVVGGLTPLTNVTVTGNNLFLPRIVTNPLSAQSYDALNNITLTESRTQNAPIAFTADSDDSGTGSFILLDGVTLVATNNAVNITAADLDLQGGSTVSSGSSEITITASADGGIGLGDATDQLSISGDELSRMSSSGGINVVTTGAGNITVNNVLSTDSQNISGLTTLDAQGTGNVVINGTASTFNGLTLNSTGGTIQVGANLNTTNDDITFQTATAVAGASTINSGGGAIDFDGTISVDNPLTLTTGNGALTLADSVTSTSTLTMSLGGGSVTGLDQLGTTLTGLTINSSSAITLPEITVNGPVDFNTGLITVDGNISGIGVSFGNVTQINADALNLSSGTGILSFANLLGVGANDLTLTGDEINLSGAATGTGDLAIQASSASQNVVLGGTSSTSALDLGDSDLGNLLSNWNTLTLGRNDGTGTLDLADDVNLASIDLTLNGAAGIGQSGGDLTANGDVTLWSNSGSIVLDGAGNTLGALAVTGTPTALTVSDTTDITQSAAWSLGAASVTLDAAGNDILLTQSGNAFGTVSVTAETATVDEDDATDLGTSTVTDLTVVSTGAISTSAKLAVSDTGDFETRDNAGSTITIANGSTFGTINAVANTGDGSTLADGDVSLSLGGSAVLGELGTAGDLSVEGTGAAVFTQTVSSSITADGLELKGAGSDHQLDLGTNAINTLAGNVNTVVLVENSGYDIGAVNTTGLTVADFAQLSSEGTVTQSEAISAPNLLIEGTTGDFTLNNTGNAITTLAANSGDLALTENSGFAIGSVEGVDGVTLTGNLMISSTGTVTQSELINSDGLEVLGAAGNYVLDTVDNDVTTLAGNTGNVDFRDDNGFVIGTVNTTGMTTTGDTILTSTDSVTQTEAIVADGLALVGTDGDFVLTNSGNTVATLAANTGDIDFSNSATIDIGSVNPSGVTTTGDFSLTANGAITQTEAMNIGGDLALTTTHAAGDVDLTHIIPATTRLGDVLIGGDFTLVSTGKSVAQELGTSLQVAGDLNIDAASLSLDGVGNIVGGTTTTPSVSELRQAGVITLGNISEAASYSVVSEATTKTFDSGAVHGAAIVLNDVDNVVGGSISLTTSAPSVSAGVEVQTGINQAVGTTISVVGTATFIAEDSSVANSGVIDLTNSGNSFGSLVVGGTDVVVLEDTGATVIQSVNTDSLELTSAGTITQTGSILTSDLLLDSAVSIALNNAGNDVDRIAAVAPDGFSFVDIDDLAVGAIGSLNGIETTDTSITVIAGDSLDLEASATLLSGAGDISLTAANVVLNDSSSLDASSGGSIALTGTDDDSGANGSDVEIGDSVVIAASNDVTITGDDINLHNAGGTAPSISGAGTLTIQSRDDGDSNPSFSVALDSSDVDFGTTFTAAQIGRSGNLADVTLGSSGLTVDGAIEINGGEVLLTGDLESTSAAAMITLAAADNLTLGNVTSNNGTVDLTATAGNIAQTGVLENVDTLIADAGGNIVLDGANTLVKLGNIDAGTGIEIYDDAAGLTIDGDITSASGNIQIHNEGGDMTLADGRTLSIAGTGDVALAAGANFDFDNQSTSGSAPIVLGDGRYLIYSKDYNSNLGNLTASPYMGITFAANAPATITGTDSRVLFADQATLTFTADDLQRFYGDSNPVFTYAVSGYLAGDNASTAFSGNPLLNSTAVDSDNVGFYTISAALGTLVSDKGYILDLDDGALEILAATLYITADGLSKTYGELDPGLTFGISGLKLGHGAGDVLTGGLVRIAGESVAGGPYAIYQGSLALSNSNYTLDYTAGNFTVDPKIIDLSGSRIYNGLSSVDSTILSLDNLFGSETLSLTGSGSMSDKHVGDDKVVSINTLTLGNGTNGGVASNYSLVGGTHLVDISQLAITVTADEQTKIYGNADSTLSYRTDVSLAGSDNFSGSLGRSAGENVADGPFAINQGSLAISDGNTGGNYDLTYVGDDLTITQRAITLDADTLSKTYGDADPTLGVSISSGSLGSVTVSDSLADVTGTLTRESGENVGSYDVLLGSGTQAANYNITYLANNDALTIDSRIIDLLADRTYNGSVDLDAIAFTLDNLLGIETLTLVGTGSMADKHVGVDKAVSLDSLILNNGSNGGLASNYTLVGGSHLADISQLAITVSADSQTKVYGDADPSLTYQTNTSLVGSDSYSGALARTAGENVASGPFAINQGTLVISDDNGGANYDLTYVGEDLNITPRPVDLDGTRIYDGNTTLLNGIFTLDNLVGSETLVLGGSGTMDDKNVATDKTVNLGSFALGNGSNGGMASNYTLAGGSHLVDITPASVSVVGINAVDKIYDGTTTATIDTSGAVLVGVIASDDALVGSITGDFDNKNVGTDKSITTSAFVLTGTDGGNYTLEHTGGLTADVTPRTLGVTATGNDKVYDGSTDATVTLDDNRIAGDELSFTYTATFSDGNVGSGKFIAVSSISMSGTDAGNYVNNTSTATFSTISQATLSIIIDALDRIYDGTTAATVQMIGGIVSGDDVIFAYDSAQFDDKNVGVDKSVSVSGIFLTGADADKYVFDSDMTTTGTITAATLVVSGIGVDEKVYDSTTGATVVVDNVLLSGLVSGDDFEVAATGTFNNKNVGDDKVVTLSSSYTGDDLANYTITDQLSTTADVIAANLTISGITASGKVYDSTTAATVTDSGVIYTGLFAGDDVTVAATGAFANKNAGDDKDVNLSSNYSGVDLGNYAITDQAVAIATITPAALTVSGITANDKVYNGNTVAIMDNSDAVFTGLIAGDVLIVDATGTFADKNVGDDKAVSMDINYSGSDAGNYTITDQATTTADITAATLVVSGIAVDEKVYDSTTGAIVDVDSVLFSGLVSGDDLEVAATGIFDNKNVGDDKVVTLSSSYTGDDLANYTITDQVSTTADVTAADLTISGITASGKVYDSTTAANVTDSGAVYTGLFAGDDVTVAATGAFANKNAGDDKDVNLSSNYSGVDLANYAITDQAVAIATITPAALTVSGITANDKIYNGNTVAIMDDSDAVFTGLFAGDVLIVNATGTFADKNVGDDKAVSLDSNYSGSDAGNYSITDQTTTTTADISHATLVVSGIAADSKIYDGNVSANLNLDNVVLSGFAAGDDLTLSAVGVFENSDLGFNKTVDLASSYSGSDVSNYIITDQEQTTASIKPVPVSSPLLMKNMGPLEVLSKEEEQKLMETEISESTSESIIEIEDNNVKLPEDSKGITGFKGKELSGNFTRVREPDSVISVVNNLFVITLTAETFEHSNPDESIKLFARLSNGDELPGWITFDSASWTFSGKSPSMSTMLNVLITARDSGGNEVTTTLEIKFIEQQNS